MTLSSDGASEAQTVRKTMTPPELPERKRVLITETKPPKTDSDSEDDAVLQPVVKIGKQPHEGVAKPMVESVRPERRNVLKEVPSTDPNSDDDVASPPGPVVKRRTKPRSGAAKNVRPERRNVLKEVPNTDLDSDEEVVPPPEPLVKPRTKTRSGAAKGVLPQRRNVLKEPRTKLRSGGTKGVRPKRRNTMKEAPTLGVTTHSDSEAPEPTVKTKSRRVVAKGIIEKPSENLVGARRSARVRNRAKK
ncbi:hypothetical protein B0H14DRAFT_2850662 [Mycena olivaceomarginata]|nr:hypothetical protein B0H14DRAFT_2850662 [Mycena olivaceomarginata]